MKKKQKKQLRKKKTSHKKMPLPKLISLAIQYHSGGNLIKAEEFYKKILKIKPDHPEMLSNLGSLMHIQGKYEEAVKYHTQALLVTDFAEANCNLANAYCQLNQKEKAAGLYKKALSMKPSYQEAKNNLGIVLANIALEKKESGNYEDAVIFFTQSIEVLPTDISYLNLGNTYLAMNNIPQAITCYHQSLALKQTIEAYNNIGHALVKQTKYDEAIEQYHKALELDKKDVELLSDIGVAHYKCARRDKAVAYARQAIALNPNFARPYYTMGVVDYDKGNLHEAINYSQKAIELNADYADAHYLLGESFLTMGEFAKGWKEYEWRWKRQDFAVNKRNIMASEWNGIEAQDQKILVWGEQGVGDEIRYASMIPDLIQAGAVITLESEPRLVPLFTRSFPEVHCIPHNTAIAEDFDVHISSTSLAQFFRNSPKDFPTNSVYLKADSRTTNTCRKQYDQDGDKFLVGISWTSSTSVTSPLTKSSLKSLLEWDDVLTTKGVTFVNLQYGDHQAEIDEVCHQLGVNIISDENIDPLKNMDSFASQVDAMDLVISIGNATIEVAGALGKPTLMVQSTFPTIWAFLAEGESYPWQSSLKIYRWPSVNTWEEVKMRVCQEIKASLNSYKSSSSQKVPVKALV